MDGVHHVGVEEKLLAEIVDWKQLENMNSDIAATEAAELEHVDPDRIASRDRWRSVQEEGNNYVRPLLRRSSRKLP